MPSTPKTLMYEAVRLLEEVDRIAGGIDREVGIVFGKLSLKIPEVTPPELGFLQVVSWSYALYFEVGKVGVDFLRGRLEAYRLDPDKAHGKHIELVNKLRTYTQHSIEPSKRHDNNIQRSCEEWFLSKCSSRVPGETLHWKKCLVALLKDVIDFLNILKKCLRAIELDDSREILLTQWKLRRARHHPANEFDDLIAIVIRDIGRDALDIRRFRQRYYDSWKKDLDLLQGNYDFQVEGRKLIEHALLTDTTPILPLTGSDIMQVLGIQPGPKVGELLKKALEIYTASPCSKEELLATLRDNLGPQP